MGSEMCIRDRHSTPDGSRVIESSDGESVTCLSDRETQKQTTGSINDDAQLTPAESPSSCHTSPLAFDANESDPEDHRLDEDDTVSSSSDAGIPRVANIEPVLDLPWGSSPIPGPSKQPGTGGTQISWNKEITGTACIGRHAFSARHPSPCLLYTSPSPRDLSTSRMPSSA